MISSLNAIRVGSFTQSSKGAKTQREPGHEITALRLTIYSFFFAPLHPLRLGAILRTSQTQT
jgi:hypothetical protein